ncbi:MAG: type II secretion system inner membrane protein GspF [Thermodesulfobacteriota bacterium]|nr:type II secretion system inner membrane protein GspF [Thermodesulfobacteriota bacterium]
MPVFEYKALTSKGKKSSGIIDAKSLTSAGAKLRQQNIFIVSIKEVDSEFSTEKKSKTSSFFMFSRVQTSEMAMITRQMATLLSAGFPLVSAVSTLTDQTKSKAFQKILSKIKDSIEEGNSFAAALSMYPSVFSQVYVSMVNAGESSGTLEIVLERLADITEKREETKKNLQASLAYPVLMAFIGAMVLFFLLTYIVPGIIDIFSDMNQTLPGPTLFLISVSSFFKTLWWLILLIPVVLFFLVHMAKKSEKGAYIIDKTLFNIPKAGELLQKLSAARFTRILGSLLENGVPMLTALDIARTITGNRVFTKIISQAAEAVEQGGELGYALEAHSLFPSLASQMIRVGEKSGELEKMLEKTADLYEKEVESSVAAITALIEPLIILVMGAVVGFIVLSICLPIFEMNQLVQ